MIADLWQSIKQLWTNQSLLANLVSIFAVISSVYGFVHFMGKVVRALIRFLNRERLHHRLKPYFNREEIQRAIGIYIPTQCQNVDPAAAEEPARVHAFAVRQKLIPFFIKKVFREKKEEKYYLVLADSGMGKTTFMINLFLKYTRKRFKTGGIVLVPLGHPKADEKIDTVNDKPRTILLLDAFDEDSKAARDYKARIQEIIDKTLDFQAVIITSRTQFFPTDPDIPQETGLYKFGGAKGEHRFYRLYILPFTEGEVRRYLRRLYPFYLWFKRCKARAIVAKSPYLMVRPMLLANIRDLMAGRSDYRFTYEIYAEMVERWIQRERVKDKAELRKFSEVLARDMYENQQARGGLFIPLDQVGRFAGEHGIRLEELEMRSRSLLNRSAEGKYKFAHKSILEYLLSLDILRDPGFRASFNYDNMEQTRRFYYEQFLQKIVIPFFSRPLKGFFCLFDKYSVRSIIDNKEIDKRIIDNREINISRLDVKELENIALLNLSVNQITDLTPLKELKNLYRLYLRENQITDLTPLKELKNLYRLYLSDNQITDLTPLKELKNLKELSLVGNQITDLTPLKELKNLEYLVLGDNQITDLTPLKELKNLQELYLSDNQITDLTALKELKNLQKLYLSNNQITDLTPLKELKNLKYLYFSSNRITDLTPLLELNRLIILDLTGNPIKKPNAALEELRRRLGSELYI